MPLNDHFQEADPFSTKQRSTFKNEQLFLKAIPVSNKMSTLVA